MDLLEAKSRIAEALAAIEKSAERWWEAELYRLKGTLVLKQSGVPNTQHPTLSTPAEAEAQACFHKAIEIARRQGTKALELRAVMSLSRLWHGQGKTGEARQMLAAIYGWFTEGFDTADLRAAKTLLEGLSHPDGPAMPPPSST